MSAVDRILPSEKTCEEKDTGSLASERPLVRSHVEYHDILIEWVPSLAL